MVLRKKQTIATSNGSFPLPRLPRRFGVLQRNAPGSHERRNLPAAGSCLCRGHYNLALQSSFDSAPVSLLNKKNWSCYDVQSHTGSPQTGSKIRSRHGLEPKPYSLHAWSFLRATGCAGRQGPVVTFVDMAVLHGGRHNGFGFEAVSGNNKTARRGCAERRAPAKKNCPKLPGKRTRLRDPPLRAAKIGTCSIHSCTPCG